ncbi:hypothetical protein QJS66_12345 [Kocuria rhizophila]|nr:hypothetical protein QJS66_12345 [Kocuria rhizophila]
MTKLDRNPGDVIVADRGPPTREALGVLAPTRLARVHHVEMDHDGMQPEAVAGLYELAAEEACAVRVRDPSFQNPTGATMPEEWPASRARGGVRAAGRDDRGGRPVRAAGLRPQRTAALDALGMDRST